MRNFADICIQSPRTVGERGFPGNMLNSDRHAPLNSHTKWYVLINNTATTNTEAAVIYCYYVHNYKKLSVIITILTKIISKVLGSVAKKPILIRKP